MPAKEKPHLHKAKYSRHSEGLRPPPVSRAKQRWQALTGKISAGQFRRLSVTPSAHGEHMTENLIEEIKRMTKSKQAHSRKHRGGGILNILQNRYSDEGSKGLEKQKYSAKERIMRKRESNSLRAGNSSFHGFSIQDYDNEARLRYPITSEIRIKLERIKRAQEQEYEKQAKEDEGGGESIFKRCLHKCFGWLGRTNLGETVKANHRFYRMNPHDHMPKLCRRCRRPLSHTLDWRFTSVGILFCFLLPLVGILLLYANREFYCVVCEEQYVYGDLTARVEEFGGSDAEDDA